MTEDRSSDSVLKLLRLLGEQLEGFLDGDETAFEALGESIEQGEFSADDLQAAILVLRSLGGFRSGVDRPSVEGSPGRRSLRIPSAEERERLSPEAWGYLLGLRQRGALDPEQFERVLDLLAGSGVFPVDVDLARDVATRVALRCDQTEGTGETRHGDFDLAH